jgi:hypothetical protein
MSNIPQAFLRIWAGSQITATPLAEAIREHLSRGRSVTFFTYEIGQTRYGVKSVDAAGVGERWGGFDDFAPEVMATALESNQRGFYHDNGETK